MRDQDDSDRLLDAVAGACARGESLSLLGSGSKNRRFPLLHCVGGSALSTVEHSGVLYYAPDELVLEARSGTLGGAIAAGLAGPARPWAGAPRDAVLGVELINGRAERLRFGGRVVKNVAGYDLARLQAGAFGTLGCLLSVAVRVMPAPATELTLEAPLDEDEALRLLAAWHHASLPVTASCWIDGELSVRLAGPAPAVEQAAQRITTDASARTRQAGGDWDGLRDHDHPFFTDAPGERRLYRCSLPFGVAPFRIDAPLLSEWRGAQRWYWLQEGQESALAESCRASGGWLAPADSIALTPVDSTAALLQQRLREAFDPKGCFNAHLLTPEASHAH